MNIIAVCVAIIISEIEKKINGLERLFKNI